MKIDLVNLAEFLVENYDYDTLVQAAVDGTYNYLKSLDKEGLAEEIEIAGYKEVQDV